MDIKKVENEIINILHYKFGISFAKLINGNENIPLTGRLFQLSALDMTYLFLEVEKEFDCVININQVMSYEFNTIKGISKIIGSTI